MKGVGRRGGIYPLCFDTSRDVWKAGRGYIAAAQTRDIAAVRALRRITTGPVDTRRHEKGVYLIKRAEETLVAVLRE